MKKFFLIKIIAPSVPGPCQSLSLDKMVVGFRSGLLSVLLIAINKWGGLSHVQCGQRHWVPMDIRMLSSLQRSGLFLP